MAAKRILIMAGGTGGHVFPALAVAARLQALGLDVCWLGTRRGLESKLVPEAGIPLYRIGAQGLRGKRLHAWLLAPLWLALAVLQCMVILIKTRPAAVLGVGGFVTGPGGVAAWLLRRPLVLHEQNAALGLANRWLAPLASHLMEGFPGTFPAHLHAVATGNPVRGEIAALAAPEQRLRGRSGRLRLLIIGGSQGAQVLNETVPQALALLDEHKRPEVWHQAGGLQHEATLGRYRQAGVEARVVPFITDMAEAYGWADLVICRAGALTLAELAAAGLASVLVPYPHAVDDHQTRNAGYLVQAGAAVLILQQDLSPRRLSDELRDLARDRERLIAMAGAARRLAQPQAAARAAEIVAEAAGCAALTVGHESIGGSSTHA